MSLPLRVDPKSGVPLYVQIREQIKYLIATGVLGPGDQLPTIRELAVELTVNPNTVARAYSELEREGFLATQQGRGTFVLNNLEEKQLARLSREKLCAIVEQAIIEAVTMGYTIDEIKECVENQIARWQKRQVGK